jgi:glycosyl transferase family 25
MKKWAIDAVYVLSVKTFADRIDHVLKELDKHRIPFEFIFEYDIESLTSEIQDQYFGGHQKLELPQRSLVLKHIQAWRQCVNAGHQNILVFEDDVLLKDGFVEYLKQAMDAVPSKDEGYLLFLGGEDTKVPDAFLLSKGLVIENPIATAEAYVTNQQACIKRMAWLESHKVELPADFLLRAVDPACGIKQYWVKTAIASQGSVTGVFQSSLDGQRRKHSLLFNQLRFHWQKFNRKKIRKVLAIMKKLFK